MTGLSEKETKINKLLVFMNNELELAGEPIDLYTFDFLQTGSHSFKLMNSNGWSFEDLNAAIKVCAAKAISNTDLSILTVQKVTLN